MALHLLLKTSTRDHLANVIKEHFELAKFDIDFWKSNLEISQSENEPGAGLFRHYDVIDICYIGGGNALLFFKSIEDYSDILKKFFHPPAGRCTRRSPFFSPYRDNHK